MDFRNISFRRPKNWLQRIGFKGPNWLQKAEHGLRKAQNWLQELASEGQNWFQRLKIGCPKTGFRRPNLAPEDPIGFSQEGQFGFRRPKLVSEAQTWLQKAKIGCRNWLQKVKVAFQEFFFGFSKNFLQKAQKLASEDWLQRPKLDWLQKLASEGKSCIPGVFFWIFEKFPSEGPKIGFRGLASKAQIGFRRPWPQELASEGQNWFQRPKIGCPKTGFRRPNLAPEDPIGFSQEGQFGFRRPKLVSEAQTWLQKAKIGCRN